jgi:anti-sigma factor RsiW
MTCEEAQELITALIDRELLDPERSSLEFHLQECSHCRLVMEREQLVKQALHAGAERVRAPGVLRDRILSDPRLFPERNPFRWQDYLWPTPRPARVAMAAGFLLIIGLAAFLSLKPPREPIASVALETYERFAKGELSVRRMENPDEVVAQLTRAVAGHLHPMGYDLTVMHLQPVAGLVREINNRKVLIAIYEGQGGTLFCYTFFGSEADAPADAARFLDPIKKINFYAFSRGNLNAVLHREGELICILASEMPMDDLLALAKAKARPS